MSDPVVIAAPDPRWPAMFEEERARLAAAAGGALVAVEHIGSTAVPGLAAKPIVDIMAGVRRLADAAALVEPLRGIAYRYVPEMEAQIPDRRFFVKGDEPRTHHLHVVEFGGGFWEDHLLFRDRLRARPDVVRAYEELKRDLAAKFRDDRDAYTRSKSEFVNAEIETERLAKGFRRFAAVECRGIAPLYDRLSTAVADDDGLLALVRFRRPGQPAPNLLFGAVQDLLLSGARHPVAAWYPSVGGDAAAPGDYVAAFRDFAVAHAEEIRRIASTRLVQTNEVGRCVVLALGFAEVIGRTPGRLHVIDAGASAGLNLRFDRYGYSYSGRRFGDPTSPVQIATEVRGAGLPVPGRFPQIAARVGVDLNPIDVRDEEQARWLRALVWPDHAHRLEQLDRAMEIARRDPPSLIRGDAAEVVTGLLERVPSDVVPCVYHTHALFQFSAEAKARLQNCLAAFGARRDLYWISQEPAGEGFAESRVTAWERGRRTERLLARAHSHGRWVEWIGSPESGVPSPKSDRGEAR